MENGNIFEDNKHNQKDRSTFFMLTTVILFVLSFAGAIYVANYANFDGVDEKMLKARYVEKTKITYEDLPIDIKEQYIQKSQIDLFTNDKIQELQTQLDELKKQLVIEQSKVQDKNNPFAKTQTDVANIAQEEQITKALDDVKNIKQSHNTNDMKFVKQISCDDMGAGRYTLSPECSAKLKKFLSNYNDKYTYEVIPTVNDEDFSLINKFKAINEKLAPNERFSKDRIELMAKYSNTGLGKYRSNEAGWLIKKQIGKDANIRYTPYQIHTKIERGVIIKVYK